MLTDVTRYTSATFNKRCIKVPVRNTYLCVHASFDAKQVTLRIILHDCLYHSSHVTNDCIVLDNTLQQTILTAKK